MEFLIVIGLYMFFVLVNETFGAKRRKLKILSRIRGSWGKPPVNEYNAHDYERFANYHNVHAKKRAAFTIDDITWNDLELDKVYTHINCTHTSMGDEILYSILRTPLYDRIELEKRENLIEYWTNNRETREGVQLELEKFGKFRDKGPSALLGDSKYLELDNNKLYKFLSFVPFLSALIVPLNLPLGLILLIITAAFNFLYHDRKVREMEEKICTVNGVARMIALAGILACYDLGAINDQRDLLAGVYKPLKAAKKKFSRKFFLARSGNLLEDFKDMIKSILMTDLWSYNATFGFLKERTKEIARMLEIIGLWDATICIASFRESLDSWCVPKIQWHPADESEYFIHAENVKHPMVSDCVGNPVCVRKPVLLTGSNASGKSTYLKIVVLNTLFAHTIMTCIAESWTSIPLYPITSIALRDNVLNGESYFVAEIKSLRRIFEAVNGDVRCLCIVDEVLRGTNTIERIAASSSLLFALASLNTCVFAATHDVELTGILKDKYENMHFEEVVTDNDITFDYKLKEGRATSRNAIKLLGIMGFDPAITDRCMNAVSSFEKKAHWDAIN